MSSGNSRSGDSTPGDNVEIAGETDEGFVQIESKKKPSSSGAADAGSKKSTSAKQQQQQGKGKGRKPEIAAAVGDDDPLIKTSTIPVPSGNSPSTPTSAQKAPEGAGETAAVAEEGDAVGGGGDASGDDKGGGGGGSGTGWWSGFGGIVQAAKTTAAKVGAVAEAALNELTKEDEEEEGEAAKEAKETEGAASEEGEDGWENAGDAEVAAGKKGEAGAGGVPRSESNQSGSWGLGGWLQVAKDKTVAGAGAAAGVLDLVRRDLTEFTQETGSAVSSTATRLKDRLHITEGVSNVISAVSGAFYIPPEDEGEEAILVTESDALVLGRFEKDLHDLRRDSATYLTEPQGNDADAFAKWSADFDLASKQQEMSDALVKLKEVRDNYARIVPAKATHTEFWLRYFYKVDQLRAAEEKRKEIKKRAEEAVAAVTEVGKETSDWDDDVM